MMRTTLQRASVLAVSAALGAACGEPEDMMMDDPDAGVQVGQWSSLLTKSWQLPPGGEDTSDLAIETVDRDIYIGAIRPLAPPGTHHTLLFRGLTGTNAIYASGVGTGELEFPPGKGLLLTKGTTIGLQLHIYNTGDEMITGTSGIEIKELDASDVTEEVDMFLPGPKNLSIPPGTSSHSGTCTVGQSYNVFALFPHMHQLGTHLKTTLVRGGTNQVLHDAAYDFEHQSVISFTPISLAAGDKIITECTWNNPTSANVTYGESSTTEMCYSILYRYPKGNNEFCTQ